MASTILLFPKVRTNWVPNIFGQQENSPANDPDPILLPYKDLMSHVFDPMDLTDAKTFKLMYDLLSLTKEKYPVPTTVDTATIIPANQIIVLTPIPVVFAVVYGGILPKNLWQAILDALVTTKPWSSITGVVLPQKVWCIYMNKTT